MGKMNPNQRTKVLIDDEMQKKIIKGIDILNDVVSQTLGARSRSVGIDYGYMRKINKDGVSVAKAINLEDPVEQFGVATVREAAQKTVDIVGDGTTVSIILAHAFIHESLKQINSGVQPMSLRNNLNTEVDKLIAELDKMAIPVKTLEQKINIATISASGEKDLGELIANTLDKVGDQGVVTVQESKSGETTVDFQEGMQLEYGMYSELFATDPERGIAVYEDIPVLITDKELNDIDDFSVFMQQIAPQAKKMVIIAPAISDEILKVLLLNKMGAQLPNGNIAIFPSLFIKAPGVGNNQRDILADLCAVTGAKYISLAAGQKFADVKLEDLGKISKIVASKLSTIITSDKIKNKLVEERLALIENQLKDETSSGFDKKKLEERRAKLTNGVAVIKVGGTTEIEMNNRKEKVEDALNATRAAIKEGIVPGGEIALLNLKTDNAILQNVLKAPFEKLVENAGYDPGEKRALIGQTVDEVNFKAKDIGFDVTDGQFKDMIKAGIIDPVMVPKTALRNALSVAIEIIEMGSLIVPLEEKK